MKTRGIFETYEGLREGRFKTRRDLSNLQVTRGGTFQNKRDLSNLQGITGDVSKRGGTFQTARDYAAALGHQYSWHLAWEGHFKMRDLSNERGFPHDSKEPHDSKPSP